jgi:hypothetical protein
MITRLEYFAWQERGKASKRRSDGQSYWRVCPFCGNGKHKFHIRPPIGKQRWCCYACGEWGDEWDLIRRLHADDLSPDEQRRLFHQLNDEWEQLHPDTQLPAAEHYTYDPDYAGIQTPPEHEPDGSDSGKRRRGRGRRPEAATAMGNREEARALGCSDARSLEEAAAQLTEEEMQVLDWAYERADGLGCDLTALAGYVYDRHERARRQRHHEIFLRNFKYHPNRNNGEA